MHDQHHAHQPPGDDIPTLMFQRSLPGNERCTICPFRSSAAPIPSITAPHRPAPIAHRHTAPFVAPANAPPAMLPRPALLATDLRGSGTLVLPDALRSAGPDAATIERPGEPYPHPYHPSTGRAARDPDFDELASPDITVLQPTTAPARPVQRRPLAPLRPARPYLALNLCLGLLIVGGLVLLATREAPSSTAPSVSASE